MFYDLGSRGVLLWSRVGAFVLMQMKLNHGLSSGPLRFVPCGLAQAAAWIRGAREAGADVAQVAAALPPLPIPEPNALRRTVYNVSALLNVWPPWPFFLSWVGDMNCSSCCSILLLCLKVWCDTYAKGLAKKPKHRGSQAFQLTSWFVNTRALWTCVRCFAGRTPLKMFSAWPSWMRAASTTSAWTFSPRCFWGCITTHTGTR